MRKIEDMTGRVFGRLEVISYSGKSKSGHSMWLCKCECGNEKSIERYSLIGGRTRSCGCLDKEKHITSPNRLSHGKSKTRPYRIWKKMRSRCRSKNDPDYKKYYGNRGISVCAEWDKSFDAFYCWAIKNGYSDNLSLDRIDVNGNYEPQNCRWATAKQQANNKRKPNGGDCH